MLMKAVVQNAYGSPDVFELKEVDKPVVKDNDVLVCVHAAALHAGDYFIMRGVPYLVRLSTGWQFRYAPLAPVSRTCFF